MLDVALVTAAPLVLDAVAPAVPLEHVDAVARLRAACSATLAAARARRPDVVLVVGVGEPAGVRTVVHGDLRGFGHPAASVSAPVAAASRRFAGALGARVPVLDEETPAPPDLVVLAAQVATALPDLPVVGLSVAVDAPVSDLEAVGRAVAAAAGDTGRLLLVVAADLSASRTSASPGHLVEGAPETDDAIVAALRAGGRAAATRLANLGPVGAAAFALRGYAPLLVAATSLATGTGADVDLLEVRGVGHAVGLLEGPAAP